MTKLSAIALGICAVLLCGCGGFDRSWSQYEPTEDATGLSGRWSGSWVSTKTGHDGELRAIITPAAEDGQAGAYDAWFWAKYGGVLTFDYVVRLVAEPAGEDADGLQTLRFSGEADLGSLAGGVYHYDGSVTGDQFDSTYKASADEGTFQMTRVD